MPGADLIDFRPLLALLGLALLLALVPLAWWWWRHRGAPLQRRLAALTTLILVLTLDLIVVGAFTRLTDSGLGCPDWPGCYGAASPLGARGEISAAQAQLPDGPVTHGKAWIEMVHRYLAMTVGALILVAAGVAWAARRRLPLSPWWATATLVWVLVQGLFGKFTVTLKLYPLVVTLHLLGAQLLLVLLVLQHESFRQRPLQPAPRGGLAPWMAGGALAVLLMQIGLGGWVSTNYAVLACQGFPACNGQWWPAMDSAGFTLLRPLGQDGAGGALPFAALVGIHMAHRLFALVVVAVLLALAWVLWRHGERRAAAQLGGLLAWQLASGLSNVVLGWPLAAALAHSAGAAVLVALLSSLWVRLLLGRRLAARGVQPATVASGAAALQRRPAT